VAQAPAPAEEEVPSSPSPPASIARPPLASAYPPGRWRLAPPAVLTNVVIGTSHILIRFGGVDTQVAGSPAPWRLEPPPRRSRDEALALAEDISRRLDAEPARFEQLARQYSEDRTTAREGGHQGAGRATDFFQEPNVLDALAVLGPGAISRVLETQHGFQIIRREPLPPPAIVAGRHIVIGHDDSRWLELVGAAAPPRSHADALVLATEIYEEAAAHPERFEALVAKYSEHPDRVYGGDMGAWSLREPTHYPRGVRALASLAAGGVHAPVESHVGFEIIQRTEEEPRATYAMEAIKLAFQPGDVASRDTALRKADELLKLLSEDPSRFGALQQEYCCSGPERWIQGHEEPGLTPLVQSLALGEVASRPAVQYVNVVIPRRIDPASLAPEPAARSELPAPDKPPILWGMARMPSRAIARQFEAASIENQAALALSPAELAGVQRVTAGLDDERRDDRGLLRHFEELLGQERSRRLFDLIEQRLARELMEAGAP
jgi:hypothetical protein